jgi:hypothetical protein
MQEVGGSIPPGSTNQISGLRAEGSHDRVNVPIV